MVDVNLNWLNWLYFVILEGGLLVILRDCMIIRVWVARFNSFLKLEINYDIQCLDVMEPFFSYKL